MLRYTVLLVPLIACVDIEELPDEETLEQEAVICGVNVAELDCNSPSIVSAGCQRNCEGMNRQWLVYNQCVCKNPGLTQPPPQGGTCFDPWGLYLFARHNFNTCMGIMTNATPVR